MDCNFLLLAARRRSSASLASKSRSISSGRKRAIVFHRNIEIRGRGTGKGTKIGTDTETGKNKGKSGAEAGRVATSSGRERSWHGGVRVSSRCRGL